MKKGLIPIIAILVVGLLITGFTASKEKDENLTLQERIEKLEAELALLKLQVRKTDGLEPDVIKDDPIKKAGPRFFLDGARGWQENGSQMWTALSYDVGINTPLPQYDLDINGNIRIVGGIHDGAGFGTVDYVLVADGAGAVAWEPSPAGVAGDYIWNQYTAPQSPASWWIDGKGKAVNAIAGDTAIIGIETASGRGVLGQSSPAAGNGVGVTGIGGFLGVVGWYELNPVVIGVLGMYDNIGVFGQSDVYGGAGVFAYGFGADAVYGETESDTTFGAMGWNTETAGGTGICGIGNDGTGGALYWAGSGVSGSSNDIGVYGYGNATMYAWGMYGRSDADSGAGVVGYSNGGVAGIGARGLADHANGFGIRGHNFDATGTGILGSGSGATGWYPTAGAGVSGSANAIGVIGYNASNSANIYGYLGGTSAGVVGVNLISSRQNAAVNGFTEQDSTCCLLGTDSLYYYSSGGAIGVSAGSKNTLGGMFFSLNSQTAEFLIGNASFWTIMTHHRTLADEAWVDFDGDAYADAHLTPGKTSKGEFVVFSPLLAVDEHRVVFCGKGQVTDGMGKVLFDEKMRDFLSGTEDYHIFLTPMGETNGLSVVSRNTAEFTVKEVAGGRNTLEFDYMIVGIREGHEDIQKDKEGYLVRERNTERLLAGMGEGCVDKHAVLANANRESSHLFAERASHLKSVTPRSKKSTNLEGSFSKELNRVKKNLSR